MTLAALPPGQQRVFDFVEKYIEDHGWPPSITQICEGVGLTRSTVHVHIQAIVRKGHIELGSTSSRQLRVVE